MNQSGAYLSILEHISVGERIGVVIFERFGPCKSIKGFNGLDKSQKPPIGTRNRQSFSIARAKTFATRTDLPAASHRGPRSETNVSNSPNGDCPRLSCVRLFLSVSKSFPWCENRSLLAIGRFAGEEDSLSEIEPWAGIGSSNADGVCFDARDVSEFSVPSFPPIDQDDRQKAAG
jgi:hypothetical protein